MLFITYIKPDVKLNYCVFIAKRTKRNEMWVQGEKANMCSRTAPNVFVLPQSNLELFCEICEFLNTPLSDFIEIRSEILELFLASDGAVVIDASQPCDRFKQIDIYDSG